MKQTNAKDENGLASHVSMTLHISAWTTVLNLSKTCMYLQSILCTQGLQVYFFFFLSFHIMQFFILALTLVFFHNKYNLNVDTIMLMHGNNENNRCLNE